MANEVQKEEGQEATYSHGQEGEAIVSYADLLIHTCDILYLLQGASDDYGNPAKSWNTVTDVPCRHVSGKGREIQIGAEVVIIYDELFVEGDIDVNEQDRVEINGVTYEILSVVFRSDLIGTHHKKLYLEAAR